MLADWFSDRISPLDILALDDVDRRILVACAEARGRRQAAEAKATMRGGGGG